MNESRKPDATDDPRVRYAIERTLLAWVRTGLSRMGLGFVVARFGIFLHEIEAVRQDAMPKESTGLSLWIGTALILLGVVVNLLISAEHLRLIRQMQSLPPYGARSWLLGVGVSLVLAMLGNAWHRDGGLPCLSRSLDLNPTTADEVLDRLDSALRLW